MKNKLIISLLLIAVVLTLFVATAAATNGSTPAKAPVTKLYVGGTDALVTTSGNG